MRTTSFLQLSSSVSSNQHSRLLRSPRSSKNLTAFVHLPFTSWSISRTSPEKPTSTPLHLTILTQCTVWILPSIFWSEERLLMATTNQELILQLLPKDLRGLLTCLSELTRMAWYPATLTRPRLENMWRFKVPVDPTTTLKANLSQTTTKPSIQPTLIWLVEELETRSSLVWFRISF